MKIYLRPNLSGNYNGAKLFPFDVQNATITQSLTNIMMDPGYIGIVTVATVGLRIAIVGIGKGRHEIGLKY